MKSHRPLILPLEDEMCTLLREFKFIRTERPICNDELGIE